MREYVVRPGDSPASIASRPEMAGCPKCSRDLIAVNGHKPAVTHKNGYRSFREMSVGERLILPEKWFDGSLDALPPAYFAALPHPDGVTPSAYGVSGLGDQAALDVAAAKVGALAALGDQPFSAAVNGVAAAIDASVSELGDAARNVRMATNRARQYNTVVLGAAISAGDLPAGTQARNVILQEFSDALISARLALQNASDSIQVDIGPATIDPSPISLTAAARAAAAAIGADANYCTSVSQSRSAVNSAVHAFKVAWNASNPGNPVPISTGKYEQATADALARVLGTAPAACGVRVAPQVTPISPLVVPPQKQPGLGVGGIVGLGLLGAGAVGGAIYLATNRPAPRRRVRRVRDFP